jgi:hypothetical protein
VQYRGLKIAKDILYNIFWIGYLFIILSWLLYVTVTPFLMEMMVTKWHMGDPAFIQMLTLGMFALAKFVLYFYVLIPALAISWTLKKLEKKPI